MRAANSGVMSTFTRPEMPYAPKSERCARPPQIRLSLRLAPRARGRLLDVGCADKPYEAWFRPYVTSYIGIEYAAMGYGQYAFSVMLVCHVTQKSNHAAGEFTQALSTLERQLGVARLKDLPGGGMCGASSAPSFPKEPSSG